MSFLHFQTNVRFDKSDALRSSKIRHSKRYSDTGESSAFSAATPEERREPKTKRAKQEEEADEGLMENCDALIDWLQAKNRALGVNSGQSKASPVADRSLMSQTADELHEKEPEYKSLRMLAEDVIMDKRTGNFFESVIEWCICSIDWLIDQVCCFFPVFLSLMFWKDFFWAAI